jgi:hypothetical protein
MGDYYPDVVKFKRGYWPKDKVFYVLENTTHIEVDAADDNDWMLNHDGGNIGLQVGSINGSTPVSNSDLFNKITALLEQ